MVPLVSGNPHILTALGPSQAWRQLGVPPTSSKLEIKKAFKERIRPDSDGVHIYIYKDLCRS